MRIHRKGTVTIPEHLSKDQDVVIGAGDRVEVMTPGGGGYGDASRRDRQDVARDVARGYYTAAEAARLWPQYAEEGSP